MPPRADPCAGHTLAVAHTPTPSTDGRLVYLICGDGGCPRRRAVLAAAWRTEHARRRRQQSASPTTTAP